MNTAETAPEALTAAERDQRLRDDVRRLAGQHKDARSLTLEVCRLLFYRYGEAPNANRVYNLTRKGSLTTITEQVAAFWQGLREQTQVRIPCPGLAEEAAGQLGQFLTGLINDVSQRLDARLEAQREAARAEADQARQAAAAAEAALAAARQQAALDRRGFEAEREAMAGRLASLQQELAAERATSAHLRGEVEVWTQRVAEAQGQLREAQAMFTREVGSLRESLANAEARSAAAEQRALEMIEEERGRSRKLAARGAQAEQQAEAQGRKAEALSAQVLALTGDAAMLRGRLAAWEEERARLQAEVQRLAGAVAEAQAVPRPRSRRRKMAGSAPA